MRRRDWLATTATGARFKAPPDDNGGGGGVSPPPPPPPPPPASPPPPPPFYAGIKDEGVRGWVEQAGYKDLDGFAKSAFDTHRMRGVSADKLVQIPDDWNNAEQAQAFFARIGRPENVDGYGIQLPEGGDAEFYKLALGWLHEAGTPTRMAQHIVGKWQAYATERLTGEAQAERQRQEAGLATLKGEWGANYPVLEEQARRAFRTFGGDDADMKALEETLGTAKFLKMFQTMGEKLGEAAFHDDAPGGAARTFALSPQAAQARKDSLMADRAWVDRYMAGGATEAKELADLQTIIAQGMEPAPGTFAGPPGGR